MDLKEIKKYQEKSPQEIQIIDLLRDGDEKALALIYDHYGSVLYGLCLKMLFSAVDAEEAFQESIYKIWRASASFDANKAGLYAWMISITRNHCIDALRKKERRPQIHSGDSDVTLNNEKSAVKLAVDHLGLESQVDRLREEDREVLELSYYQGYSHGEIAEKLSLPVGTVKSRVRKAIQDLRLLLRREIGH